MFSSCYGSGNSTGDPARHEHITRVIDRELNSGNELAYAVWGRHSRILDAGAAGGDQVILERIRTARRIADVVVGKLITATDRDLQQDVYVALAASPFKASSRPGVNEERDLKFAAEKIVAKLRQSGWRLFRNPPSNAGHGHTGHTTPPLRMQPPPRYTNCDD